MADFFAVTAFIQRKDQRILTSARKTDAQDLGMPGGKIEPHEHPIIALAREVYEETGIWIKDPIRVYVEIDDEGHRTATFHVKHWSGEPHQKKGEGVVRWVTPRDFISRSRTYRNYNMGVLKALGIPYG